MKVLVPQKLGPTAKRERGCRKSFLQTWHEGTGQALDRSSQSQWLWKNRRVYLCDGTTVSMPDTDENQSAYPQHHSQNPGLGFPLARITAIFSLSCGAIINLGICRYAGKGQGEITVFRTLLRFLPTRRCCPDRPVVLHLERTVNAKAAWSRFGLATPGDAESRLSERANDWAKKTILSVGRGQ